jgi:hypothetical protein
MKKRSGTKDSGEVKTLFKNFLKTDFFQEQIEQENTEACFEVLYLCQSVLICEDIKRGHPKI